MLVQKVVSESVVVWGGRGGVGWSMTGFPSCPFGITTSSGMGDNGWVMAMLNVLKLLTCVYFLHTVLYIHFLNNTIGKKLYETIYSQVYYDIVFQMNIKSCVTKQIEIKFTYVVENAYV